MSLYPQRYDRNFPAFSDDDFKIIQKSTIGVAGCGGLGGYIIEHLARTGVGHLVIFDGDTFDVTNLNRQLFSNEHNIGLFKADEAVKRIQFINSDLEITAHSVFMDETNCATLIKDCDLVIDALDSIPTRLTLQAHCKALNIPFIHGAIGGFNAQMTTIFPGDDSLFKLYSSNKNTASKPMGNLSFVAALTASIEVSEAFKVLTHKEDLLRKKLLIIDLLTNEFSIFEL